MKTYRLQKESELAQIFQIIVLFLIVVSGFYTLSNIDFSLGVSLFLSLFILLFIGIFVSSIKKFGDKRELFLEVDIEEDRVRFNEKRVLFKDIEAFTFEHYQEYGDYYGRIYSIRDAEKETILYSREFDANNYLNEEMFVEIYTTLQKSYEAYTQKHPKKVKLQTPKVTKKLWGLFEMIDLPPRSLYYSYNGNYDASMFFLLGFALLMALPLFLLNYDADYFSPEFQDILYKIYFLTEFKEYEAHGSDVAVIAWIGFFIHLSDVYLKEQFKLLFFMSYDGNVIRVGEVAVVLMTYLYVFVLIAYFNDENIVGFWAITLMMVYMILLSYLEYKKYRVSFMAFVPFMLITLVNIIAGVLAIAHYINGGGL